jgi:hypothetical protein
MASAFAISLLQPRSRYRLLKHVACRHEPSTLSAGLVGIAAAVYIGEIQQILIANTYLRGRDATAIQADS